MIENKETLTDKTMQDWLDDTARKVREGLRIDFIPIQLYEWLVKCGKDVSHETKLVDAATMIRNRILAESTSKEGRRTYRAFAEMWNKGEFADPFDKEIERMAKRMAVLEYIKKEKE